MPRREMSDLTFEEASELKGKVITTSKDNVEAIVVDVRRSTEPENNTFALWLLRGTSENETALPSTANVKIFWK